MKHSNFYKAIQAIEELAREELKTALKCIGGEFFGPTEDYGDGDPVIVAGAFKHDSGSHDILFTRATLSDDYIEICGVPYDDQSANEQAIEFLEAGYIGFIIDAIKTSVDFDVRNPEDTDKALIKIEEVLHN